MAFPASPGGTGRELSKVMTGFEVSGAFLSLFVKGNGKLANG